MSFLFYYDNNYSDGGYYGRFFDVDQFYFYFVDVMFVYVFFNVFCLNK